MKTCGVTLIQPQTSETSMNPFYVQSCMNRAHLTSGSIGIARSCQVHLEDFCSDEQ